MLGCIAISFITIGGLPFLTGISQPLLKTYDPSISDLGYTPSGWMGDWNDITFNDNPKDEPGAVEITYTPSRINGWAGMYWLFPSSNWGDLPGKDLSSFTVLTFKAKGARGGERVEFLVGGIDTGKTFKDSIQPARSITEDLKNEWTDYSIPLKGLNLEGVIGGFGWIIDTRETAAQQEAGQTSTIYVEDINYG
jgi:hypothetical protein